MSKYDKNLDKSMKRIDIKRVFNSKDLELRFPEWFNRLKGYFLLIGVLKILSETALNSYVRLQQFLRALDEKAVAHSQLPSKIKVLIHEIKNTLPQANPELFDAKTTITLSGKTIAALAKLLQALFQQIVKNVTVVLTNNLQNVLQNAGVRANRNRVRRAVAQAGDQLAQNAVNEVMDPEAEVPSFEGMRNEFIDWLRLDEILVNELLDDIVSMLSDAYNLIFNFVNYASMFYADVHNHRPQASCADELFGRKTFSTPSYGDTTYNCFFQPETNPEIFPRQQPINPEKDEPDAPDFPNARSCKFFRPEPTATFSHLDLDGARFIDLSDPSQENDYKY
jgi:hypothetical protein